MFIPETRAMSYYSPHHEVSLDLIPNRNPGLLIEQAHQLQLPILCPASKNPAPGSELEIHYLGGRYFLELFSLERYLNGFIGHQEVRDIEYLVQEVAKDCAAALGVRVTVVGRIILAGLKQRQVIKVEAEPLKSLMEGRRVNR